MRLQRDSYAPKSCAFDAANVQFLRAHLCKSHPVLQQKQMAEDFETFFGPHLWSPSYFVASCGGAPLTIIQEYIKNQDSP